MVPKGGLEPPRVAPHAPQTCASASSATSAQCEPGVYRYRARLTNLAAFCRRRGSSASRIPSPKRLYESTVTRIASPGYRDNHQPISIASLPSLRMLPQVACGGGTPSPRNDRPDSVRIAAGMPSVIATSTGAIAFGRMWRQTIRKPLAPTACDQMTNSRSLSARNSARTSRATPIHPVRPITAMIVQIEGRRKASTARRRKKRGKTSIRSTRRMDLMLIFPRFFLLLAVLAFLRPSIWTIMAVIGLTGWMGVARLVRAEFLALKEREFVIWSQAVGASGFRIVWRHILPNAMAPVLVAMMLGISASILTESGLSFLGVRGQPPHPTSGNILNEGKDAIGIGWGLCL